MENPHKLPKEPDKRIRSVVVFFTYRGGGLMNSTRLMKLAYLTELRSIERWGKRFTDADFRHWRYGPYSQDVSLAMEGIAPEANVTIRVTPKGKGKFFLPTKNGVEVDLSKEELDFLEDVAKDWLFAPNEKLIAATKTSPPFTWTKFGDTIPFTEYAAFARQLKNLRSGRIGKAVVSLESADEVKDFVRALAP